MAAPSGTVWGSVVGDYGRVGIHVALKHTATTTRRVVTLWFWSKYSVSDSTNTLYYDAGTTSASSSKGSVSISTSVSSGTGWSTSNQVKLKTYDHTYSRGTSNWSESCAMKLSGIDRVGGTMTATTSYTVPKLDSYTVSYNANGGTGAPSAQIKYYGKNITLSATKPTRTGYTFQGWATSAGGAVAYQPGATYSANAGITLYAKWTAITYAVYYNGDGGTNIPSTQTKTYGVNLTLSTTKPTKTGYTFLGWATSAGGSVAYQPGSTYSTNAAVTLYARWQIITYSIIYDANGGTGAPASQTKNYGSTLTLSSVIPTRTNYNFLGWSPNKSATSATYSAGGSYTTNSSAIFYAVWKLAYVKPRITNMSITRCDVDGNLSDSGTYALLNFTYATDLKPRNPLITYMYNGEEQNQMLMIVVVQDPVTGEEIYSTKDTFNNVIVGTSVEGGPFSLETGHTISITLSDGEGGPDNTTIISVNLPAMKFLIDFKSGGKGMAIGKPASEDIFECALPAKFNDTVYGQVRGLGECPAIPDNANLNNYLTPGVYSVRNDTTAGTISNIPVKSAGILVVSSGLGQAINPNGTWQYAVQTYTPYCISNQASWERHMNVGDTAGAWSYGVWKKNVRYTVDSNNVAGLDDVPVDGWLRTPTKGLLPNTSGTNGGVGTSTWRFSSGYFGSLNANGDSWFGKTRCPGSSEWIGMYNTVGGGTRKGYIGHDGSTHLYIANEAGGYIYLGNATSRHTITSGHHYFANGTTYWINNGGWFNLAGGTVNGALTATSTITSKAAVHLYTNIGSLQAYTTGFAIYSKWRDGSNHDVVTRGSDGLGCALGWVGSASYATVVTIRGRTCKYQNANGTTTLSDRNLKKDFAEFTDAHDTFFDSLKPTTYKYILGSSNRSHFGYITQEVEEALETAGLTTKDFGGVNIMPLTSRDTETEHDTGEVKDVYNSPTNYLLDKGIKEEHDLIYTEFISLNTWQIQKLKKRVNEQDEEIANLKSELSELKSLVQQLLDK